MSLFHISDHTIKIGDSIIHYPQSKVFLSTINVFETLLNKSPKKALKFYYSNKRKGNDFITAFIEALLEFERKKEFSEKPSRLLSSYFFKDPMYCVAFWKRYREKLENRNPGFIYKCEEKQYINHHIGDMMLLNINFDESLSDKKNIENAFLKAKEYWKADKEMIMPEILIMGDIIVTEILPPEIFNEWYPKFTFESIYNIKSKSKDC